MRLLDQFRHRPTEGVKRYGDYFTFQGQSYSLPQPQGYSTTYSKTPVEPIEPTFADYVANGFGGDGVVFAVELKRLSIFAEARFQFRRFNNGRPGDLFGDASLSILERPWPGGTTGDLLARMILDADLAGNAYFARYEGGVVRLRPDWVEIVLAPRMVNGYRVGFERVGYFYYEGGRQLAKEPAAFLVDEVAHFAPIPDPLSSYRGMSWLTPVVREIQSDVQYIKHQQKYLENAATPNLAVSLQEADPERFDKFVEIMDANHKGVENAYKTLYTGAGADVTVIGANMQQLDFKAVRGAGETRIAMAGGIHPVVLGSSEGMAGSSLNAGNYTAAKRATADATFRPLWRNAAGSLETIVPPPTGASLWYDERDVAFLREDHTDEANIQAQEAQTLRNLLDAGYTPESAAAAVLANDWSLLKHSGLFSVQLQAPGSGQPTAAKA